MAHTSITGNNIIESLKTLGFSESADQSETGNKVNLNNGEHQISVIRGWLDSNEATRMYLQLTVIFKAFENQVQASSDRNLHDVRDWLEARTAKFRNS
jgi:hypothetical protein